MYSTQAQTNSIHFDGEIHAF